MTDNQKFLSGCAALWLLVALAIVFGNDTWVGALYGLGVLAFVTVFVVGAAG